MLPPFAALVPFLAVVGGVLMLCGDLLQNIKKDSKPAPVGGWLAVVAVCAVFCLFGFFGLFWVNV